MPIRRATADDYAAYLPLFHALGVPDPVPSAAAFVDRIMPRMWVATDHTNHAIGYITWRPYGDTAHVVQLAVDAAQRGRRIGEHLLEHVRGEARAAGCTRWYLNVKRDNTPALRLYDRVGFRFELESVVMKLSLSHVPDIAVRSRLATADEDAAIAAQFQIPVERLATFRERGSFVFVTLRDDADGLLGFAPFDRGFPGTPTFSAVRPDLASSLLAALRPHADTQFDFLRVVVEGDRPLADAVLALGAELTFEIVRLSAPLDHSLGHS